MRWVILWSVLGIVAGVFLTVLVRHVWRRAKALMRELAEASERMSRAAPQMMDPTDD